MWHVGSCTSFYAHRFKRLQKMLLQLPGKTAAGHLPQHLQCRQWPCPVGLLRRLPHCQNCNGNHDVITYAYLMSAATGGKTLQPRTGQD